jgi:hypothetical protein
MEHGTDATFNLDDYAKERKLADENLAAYRRGLDAGHEEYIARASKCDRYYLGEQWEEKTLQKLKAEGRPALTINAILAAVNTVLGEQASQRLDITFKPRRDASQDTADALTKVAMQIQDFNRFPYKEQQAFADGLIQERGYFDIRMNFDGNLQGEIMITVPDPTNVIPDPGAQERDPKTWKEVTNCRWLTLDEIALLYGQDKARTLQAYADSSEYDLPHDVVRYERKTFGDMDNFMASFAGVADARHIRRLLVLERQYYKMTAVNVFVDPNTGDTKPVPEQWNEKQTRAFAKKYDLLVMRKIDKKIRWTASTGPVVLHDSWSPYRTFTIVPFFPYFRRGRPMGMVTNLLSPQEQLNKMESQQLHVVNTTANSGWVVEAGSLVNMTEDELEERGAETGLVLVYGRGRTKPEKINSNSVPSGLDRLGSKSLNNIREIAGVVAMLGVEGSEVSGVALKQKQSRGLVQMQVVFDSLNFARQLVGEKILELIQDFYTETRILRVTNWKSLEGESEEVIINAINAAGELINNVNVGEYDVVVSSAPARDSFEETQFAEALQLRDVGVMIPDHWVIRNSHLADKKAIAEEVKKLQGLGEPTPEQAQRMAQLEMIELQLMVAKLAEQEAKAQKVGAEANLAGAKAEQTLHDIEAGDLQFGAEMRHKTEQLRATILQKAADLQNKLRLAGIHTQANREQTLYKETSKRFSDQQKIQAQLAQARLQAQSRTSGKDAGA